MIGILILPLVAFVIVFIGGLIKSGILFRIVFLLSVFSSVLMLGLFSVHFTTAVVIADGCASSLNETIPDQKMLPIVSACRTNTSLLSSFGIEDQLSFRDKMTFNQVNVSSSFAFPGIDSIINEADHLDLFTFGFNSTRIDDLLVKTNVMLLDL